MSALRLAYCSRCSKSGMKFKHVIPSGVHSDAGGMNGVEESSIEIPKILRLQSFAGANDCYAGMTAKMIGKPATTFV